MDNPILSIVTSASTIDVSAKVSYCSLTVSFLLVGSAPYLLIAINENSLDFYIKQHIKKYIQPDLDHWLFLDDIFVLDDFHERKNDRLSRFFRRNRIKKLIHKHQLFLLT
jgi:hypothetical protein